MKKYYTLLIRHSKNDPWAIDFGDYSRSVVEEERQMNDDWRPCPQQKIIRTGDTQQEIDAAVRKLNSKED